MSTATHYRHSNRISLLLFPIALAICGAISIVGAIVYAYCMVYVPVVQLAFLLPLLYGAGMGATLAFVLQKLKVRSAFLGTGIAFLFAAGSYFLSWLPWTYATFARAERLRGIAESVARESVSAAGGCSAAAARKPTMIPPAEVRAKDA